ncbi:MAG: serine hydrolase [Rhodothermales bacterium]|nr:serine hydrolase [Rhodothermales bacterium]
MRAVLLICSIGLVILLVRSGPWLSEKLAIYEDRTALEDSLDAFIRHELADKGIPGLSLSLVSGQRVVLERGYGFADPDARTPATPFTVYRVGAVSQAFTTVAVLERQERGLLNLDAPIETYLAEFRPLNPFGHPITLRQILSHQSGLPRESPIGHYFDPTEPTLHATVASLNATSLVYPPETFTKYSNAAFAVAGFVIERVQQKPFEQHLRAVLDRMDLRRTSFTPRFDLRGKLAQGFQWTYDGRAVSAPLFEPGAAPALSLYTTANDLGRFLTVLFADGKSPYGAILSPAAIEAMWTRPPATARQQTPYGLGFVVSSFGAERRMDIEDSFHGYTARLDILPDSKMGIALTANMANTNAVLERIASYAFALLRAEQAGAPLPAAPVTRRVHPALRDRFGGHYAGPAGEVTISEMAGELYVCQDIRRTRLRQSITGDSLWTDDRHAHGSIVSLLPNGALQLAGDTYTRRDPPRPVLHNADLVSYVGVYKNDVHDLFILEREGQLFTLLDWIRYFPLAPDDAASFTFPDEGMFGGETVSFVRDAAGKVVAVTLANMTFERAPDPVYPIAATPLPVPQSLDRLIQEARTASPPVDAANMKPPELVDIAIVDPLLNLDIRYAHNDNILGQAIYEEPRALLQKPVSDALFRVQAAVRRDGYGLIIFDAYQPWHLSRVLWQAAPDSLKHFFAEPSVGSSQNRACAVALNLYDLDSGSPMAMPTEVGALTPEASASYPITDNQLRWNRDFLRTVMEAEGFAVHPYTWWMFEHTGCAGYPILNESFSSIGPFMHVAAPTPPQNAFTLDP